MKLVYILFSDRYLEKKYLKYLVFWIISKSQKVQTWGFSIQAPICVARDWHRMGLRDSRITVERACATCADGSMVISSGFSWGLNRDLMGFTSDLLNGTLMGMSWIQYDLMDVSLGSYRKMWKPYG